MNIYLIIWQSVENIYNTYVLAATKIKAVKEFKKACVKEYEAGQNRDYCTDICFNVVINNVVEFGEGTREELEELEEDEKEDCFSIYTLEELGN